MRKATIELQQNWDDISGVSEKSRAKVEIFINENGIVINSNKDRFDNNPQWMTLSKEDVVFLSQQIISFYKQ